MIKIHFPIFRDENSKELSMVDEGLQLHNEINLVDCPDEADVIVFLQNYLQTPKPFEKEICELKEKYISKTILLDFDDYHEQVYDRDHFNWLLYFKRSIVDKNNTKPFLKQFNLPIEHIGYGAIFSYLSPEVETCRDIDVACLFNDATINDAYHGKGRGTVLSFLRRKHFPGKVTIFDTVSKNGQEGRSQNCPVYFNTLRRTKILINCNPDRWEGDSRLWEALASGCMVFVDRMLTPTLNPLIDHKHLIFYDLTEHGLDTLYKQVKYFLENDEMRNKIALSGYNFVKQNHMSVHRIQQVVNKIKLCNSRND